MVTVRGTVRTNRRAPMTFPLMVLALGAILAGFVGIPAALGGGNAIEHFLEPSFTASESHVGAGAGRAARRQSGAAARRPEHVLARPSNSG